MSDVTESSERALRALRDEVESGTSAGPLLSAKMERSPSPRLRPSSPDQVCPICLGEITNKSVTDSCLHRFCFSCLCEWSKVKPECPLCKQKFNVIFHSIKSMGDFQEYRLDHARIAHGLDPIVEPLDPHIFINVAVQRATRFGYRTTMGLGNRTGRSPMMFWMPQGELPPHPRVPATVRTHSSAAFAAHSSGTPARSSSSSSRAGRAILEFRKNVYRQNLWVRAPLDQDRIRESSPEFYRSNPAQTHRLVPWLTRELSVLLDVTVTYYHEHACREILSWITIYPINSFDFKRMAQPYFGGRTDHFVHEFYNFAISPYDLPAYDLQARYTPSNAELEAAAPSDDQFDVNDPSFDLPDILNVSPPTYNLSIARRHFNSMRGSVESSMRGRSMPLITSSSAPMASAQPEVIVLSSDEENTANVSEDSDSEVMIIGSVPPLHLRPTEVINLEDSDDDSDVIEIKPPTPPLIVIADGSDSQSLSPSQPSTSNYVSGPSSSQTTDAPLQSKRTARFFRPSYREYSSSSEEALPPKKRPTKKKNAERKVTGRSRNFKSSECVKSSSSDSEDSDGAMKKEEGTHQRYPRKNELDQPSDNERSNSRASHKGRRMSNRSSKQPAKVVDSSDSKSKKRVERKRGSSSVSLNCSKCSKPFRRPSTSSSSRNESPKLKKKRSMSSSSSTERYNPRRRIKTTDKESRNSFDNCEESSSPSLEDAPATLAPNPKALSKKAIILNKRKSELSVGLKNSPSSCSEDSFKVPSRNGGAKVMELLSYSESDDEIDIVNTKESDSNGASSLGMVKELPGVSIYSSDSSSTILSIGQEYTPQVDVNICIATDSSNSTHGLPQTNYISPEATSFTDCINHPSKTLDELTSPVEEPQRPPSAWSTTSNSSSNSATSSHTIVNVTSVDPLEREDQSNDWPLLTVNSAPMEVDEMNYEDSLTEDLDPCSPPSLRRFDDASSPVITLNHSPLRSDSSLSCHSPIASPPRLKSIVLRVPSPSKCKQPNSPQPPSSSSPTSTTDEEGDFC